MKYFKRICDENGCVFAVFEREQLIDVVIDYYELIEKYPDVVPNDFYDLINELKEVIKE